MNVDLENHTEEACRNFSWQKLCPKLFQKTDPGRLHAAILAKVMAWKYGESGLLLHGDSGLGKTRMMWLLMYREHMAGRRIYAFDAVSFGHECAEQFRLGDGEDWILKLSKRAIVFFDDIDKCKFTDRVESELFGLVEKRVANCLPIMATTNLKASELKGRFKGNTSRGSGIIRRLTEFCTTIEF